MVYDKQSRCNLKEDSYEKIYFGFNGICSGGLYAADVTADVRQRCNE